MGWGSSARRVGFEKFAHSLECSSALQNPRKTNFVPRMCREFCRGVADPCQQFTYDVVSKGFLRKVCGNSAESLWKFQKIRFIASGKGAEMLRKAAEILRIFAEKILQ